MRWYVSLDLMYGVVIRDLEAEWREITKSMGDFVRRY
jgi:hypothetical protein